MILGTKNYSLLGLLCWASWTAAKSWRSRGSNEQESDHIKSRLYHDDILTELSSAHLRERRAESKIYISHHWQSIVHSHRLQRDARADFYRFFCLLIAYNSSSYDLSHLRSNSGNHDVLYHVPDGLNEPPGAIDGPYVRYWLGKHWKGWSNVEHAIIFGDSWSITGFVPEGPQPNATNPLGNPEWPGETSTNGANWVDYFTYVHNESLILTANLAAGGATVDMDLIAPGVPHSTLRSLKTQMVEQFPTLYGHHPADYDWKTDSSIFIIWIGLNDIHNADDEKQHMFPAVFEQFSAYVDILYQNGARNIMFMNIPPIERAPLAEIIHTYDDWHQWVAGWNTNVTELAWNFTKTYPDATVFLFDTFKLYDDVMNEPCTFPESCGFEVTTKFCPQYSFGVPSPTHKDPKCPYSVDKYFWMNDLHPTSRTHNMTAHAIAQALSA